LKKKANVIAIIIGLSLFTQYLIFAFLDWKTGELLHSSITIDQAHLVETDITEAENLQLSYNNKYLSFINDNKLEVIDLFQNKSVFDSSVFLDSSSEMLNYKWLPDRNSLLFFTTQPGHLRGYLYSLDLNNSTNNEYLPKLDREFSFPIARVLKIEISTYTNNLYVLFNDSKQKSRLIKMDIMKGINWLDLPQEFIDNIAVSNKLGNLFVESTYDNSKRIFSHEGQERKIISIHPNDILLGSKDNTIYIGRVEDGYLKGLSIYDYHKEGGNPINLWQGEMTYENIESFISNDKKLLIKHNRQLTVFLTEGTTMQTQLPEGSIVFSPTGNIYMQVVPGEIGFHYYWRTIQGN